MDGRIDNGIVQKKEKNEKIVIKRENTTNPNVKEKIKKDEEKKRKEGERQEKSSRARTSAAKVTLI